MDEFPVEKEFLLLGAEQGTPCLSVAFCRSPLYQIRRKFHKLIHVEVVLAGICILYSVDFFFKFVLGDSVIKTNHDFIQRAGQYLKKWAPKVKLVSLYLELQK